MSNDEEEPTLRYPELSPGEGQPGDRFPLEGETWGRFLIEKCLGSGGQAAVFEALDRVGPLGHVALKVPLDPVAPGDVKRWTSSEVEPLGKLKHPNIVEVKDAGCVDGTPYVATQLVEGLPLNEHVKANPTSLRQMLDWMVQLADAVHHAHSRGIVHRDLKPLNVIITPEGQPRLIDFGLASLVSAYRPGPEKARGATVPFMAPEQVRGDPEAGHRVDVFALGGILKYLIEGKGPYGQDSTSLQAVAEGKVELADCRPGPALRRALCRVANRALAPDPRERYRTASEMARDLVRVRRRRTALAVVAGLVGLTAVVASGIAIFRPEPTPPKPVGASLDVHFQRAGQAGSYHVLGASDVPLRTGDRIQVHATLERPLVAYLVAATSDGEPAVIYPPEGEEPKPVTEIHVPADRDHWLPMTPPCGTETLLLLARPRPVRDLPSLLKELRASGPPPTLDGPALLRVDEKGPRLIPRDRERAVGRNAVTSDKGFLADLLDRVPQEWTVVRAIVFPHRPPVDAEANQERKRVEPPD